MAIENKKLFTLIEQIYELNTNHNCSFHLQGLSEDNKEWLLNILTSLGYAAAVDEDMLTWEHHDTIIDETNYYTYAGEIIDILSECRFGYNKDTNSLCECSDILCLDCIFDGCCATDNVKTWLCCGGYSLDKEFFRPMIANYFAIEELGKMTNCYETDCYKCIFRPEEPGDSCSLAIEKWLDKVEN